MLRRLVSINGRSSEMVIDFSTITTIHPIYSEHGVTFNIYTKNREKIWKFFIRCDQEKRDEELQNIIDQINEHQNGIVQEL